jgi:uncharacterized protein
MKRHSLRGGWIIALVLGCALGAVAYAASAPQSRYYRKPGRIEISVQPAPSSVLWERDVPVMMRDGMRLFANVYRPMGSGRYPVIMSVTWYGKDVFGDTPYREWNEQTGSDVGSMTVSNIAPFGAPDPAFWVPRGYIVVHADVRGAFKSEGDFGPNTPQDALDYYDLIEWAGTQSWSTGKVGLSGVSYLAYSQWFAAALHPPHLAAIMPWEGLVDHYRDNVVHGGIPETSFRVNGLKKASLLRRTDSSPPAEDYVAMLKEHPLFDQYWEQRAAKIEDITVPALICGSWSAQGNHTRGSFEGFRRIGSKDKWLVTHGRNEWPMYYDPEMQAIQAKFFDYFLQGKRNGMAEEPRVRLELRTTRDEFVVKRVSQWPVENTQYTSMYLNATNHALQTAPVNVMSQSDYVSNEGGSTTFDYRFDRETWIAGNMNLKLWVSADSTSDMDLFVGVRKFDKDGQEVYFYGFGGQPNSVVTRGWLRVSAREMDDTLSTPDRPFLKHTRVQKMRPGDVVPVEIEILPSATVFEAGSRMQLVIQGTDIVPDRLMAHGSPVNRGVQRVYTGGGTASELLVPVIPR